MTKHEFAFTYVYLSLLSCEKTETSRGIEKEKGIRGLVSLHNSGKTMVGARENDELRTDAGAVPEA